MLASSDHVPKGLQSGRSSAAESRVQVSVPQSTGGCQDRGLERDATDQEQSGARDDSDALVEFARTTTAAGPSGQPRVCQKCRLDV